MKLYNFYYINLLNRALFPLIDRFLRTKLLIFLISLKIFFHYIFETIINLSMTIKKYYYLNYNEISI